MPMTMTMLTVIIMITIVIQTHSEGFHSELWTTNTGRRGGAHPFPSVIQTAFSLNPLATTLVLLRHDFCRAIQLLRQNLAHVRAPPLFCRVQLLDRVPREKRLPAVDPRTLGPRANRAVLADVALEHVQGVLPAGQGKI